MGFDVVSFLMGKAAGGGGGGGVPLLTKTQWDLMTIRQKQAFGLVAVQDADTGFERGILYNGHEYVPKPVLIKAAFMNGGTSSGTLEYLCDSAGKYTVVVITIKDKALTDLSVEYNNDDITGDMTSFISAEYAGSIRGYCIQQVFQANDTLTVKNTTTKSGTGVQLLIFDNAVVSKMSLVGVKGNTNETFAIPVYNGWYFEAAKYGYYNSNNTIPSTRLFQCTAAPGVSTPCPNEGQYWNGGTYVITVD